MHLLRLVLIAAALVLVLGLTLLPVPASAQMKCVQGKKASGVCADATLGDLMRQRIRVLTQPSLSHSGSAVAPSADRQYEMLRDWGQALKRETYGPCTAKSCP